MRPIWHILFLAGLTLTTLGQVPIAKLLPFQGRLTDQNGVAVSNGVRVVQFKIFEVPSGGSPVWAGELHRTSVNGGLINVLLGSKTPFTGVDFDRQLYLEITVDVSGPKGTNDNTITAADPPMLPRQAILPVLFAKEAADSRLLDGHDWNAVFAEGATNPATARMAGSRIAGHSLTAAQIAHSTITAAEIASNTITSNQIADATITAAKLSAQLVLDVIVPPGTIVAFGGTNIPPGWLLCDGRKASSSQLPRLFSAIQRTWGSADAGVPGASNDFNLPDLRGLFLRGVDASPDTGETGNDPDRSSRQPIHPGGLLGNHVGSFQPDATGTNGLKVRFEAPFDWYPQNGEGYQASYAVMSCSKQS